MKWLWWTLGVVAAIVLVVVGVGAMLPQDHVASRTILLSATPEQVARMIGDVQRYPSWRRGVASVTVEPSAGAGAPLRWREHTGDESVGYEMDRSGAPARIATRITDTGLPYGGRWTFDLAPSGTGTSLTITEHGSVYNPVFRFVSRFILGHTKSIDDYAAGLAAAVGRT